MYDRIYSVGCFDHFHHGHKSLLTNMRAFGDILIIGIHDDTSIEQLKKLLPNEHQNIETRMNNLRRHADSVFIVPNIDPTFYLKNIIRDDDNKENACFIRANDMIEFPGKKFIENKIDIMYLPYTEGISSTMIRESVHNH